MIAKRKLNPGPKNIIKNLCHGFLDCKRMFFGTSSSSSFSVSSPAKEQKPPRGIALSEYTVSLFLGLKLKILGPIPIAYS